MSNYAIEIEQHGQFTAKIYPYFVQPEGAIQWAAELVFGSNILAHVTGARSHDDASALLEDKIKDIRRDLTDLSIAFAGDGE